MRLLAWRSPAIAYLSCLGPSLCGKLRVEPTRNRSLRRGCRKYRGERTRRGKRGRWLHMSPLGDCSLAGKSALQLPATRRASERLRQHARDARRAKTHSFRAAALALVSVDAESSSCRSSGTSLCLPLSRGRKSLRRLYTGSAESPSPSCVQCEKGQARSATRSGRAPRPGTRAVQAARGWWAARSSGGCPVLEEGERGARVARATHQAGAQASAELAFRTLRPSPPGPASRSFRAWGRSKTVPSPPGVEEGKAGRRKSKLTATGTEGDSGKYYKFSCNDYCGGGLRETTPSSNRCVSDEKRLLQVETMD
jgi:hypothetical protein